MWKSCSTDAPRIALTSGEPAGIGPDLCVLLGQRDLPACLTVLADPVLLQQRAAQLGVDLVLHRGKAPEPQRAGHLWVQPHPVAAPVVPGRPDPANAGYVLDLIETAVDGCLQGEFDALVTAPVHKGVINDAGIPFSGHTEFIASLTGGRPVMLLATRMREPALPLRVALATTHLPLRRVAEAVTAGHLEGTIQILDRELRRRFAIPEPAITVLGLNPHAGESGHLGREEIEVISPVLQRLRRQGLKLTGPLPADTAFLPRHLQHSDAFLAMYHDQGLPVLKFAGFGRAVNITLGLPIVRTSVDHGTALELAGSGAIDTGSLLEAITTAIQMTCHARTSQSP